MKAEKITICAALVLASISMPVFGDENLPLDSELLLEKLTAFEAEERTKFEKVLFEKTEQVIRILSSHLERETKNGKLERAIALRTKIETLKLVKDPTNATRRAAKIPDDAKRFRNSGYYVLSFQSKGMTYVEALGLAKEKGGEVFAPKSKNDVNAMLEILKGKRCWIGLRYDSKTKKLIGEGKNSEPFDAEDFGITFAEPRSADVEREVYLATNGSGGFKLGLKEPLVKNAVLAVMIFFEG